MLVSSALFRPVLRTRLLLAVCCVMAMLLVPAVANAGVWASESPYGIVHVEPTVVSADFFGTTINPTSPSVLINGKTYKAYLQGTVTGHWVSNSQLVDGVWVITWTWVPNPVGITNANVYCYLSAPPDGSYAVTMTVKDVTGVVSRDKWSFTVEAPPVFGTPQPAALSIVETMYPVVSIPVRDNSGVTSWSARYNGIPASASFDGTKVSVTNFAVVEGTNTVAVTAADARSNSSTKTWSFKVKILNSCRCHGPSFASDPLMGRDCVSCHSGSFTPDHGIYPSQFVHTPPSTASLCSGCHRPELSEEHALHNVTCMNCHQSTRPDVRLAITTGSSECAGCHSSIGHYDSVNHTATPAPAIIRISGVDFGPHACSECHSLALRNSHKASDGTAQCSSCHPQPRNSFTTWDGGCAQGNCHTFSSAKPMHDSVDASHAVPAQRATDCIKSGCHDLTATTVFQGKSIAAIHSNATTTTASGVLSSCQICHASGRTPSADCLTCHPERALSHGYVSTKHISTQDCLGTCHNTELLPAHNAEVNVTVTSCSGCHPTVVAAITPWDKTCTTCHTLLTPATHPTRTKTHVGTDAAMLAYSSTHSAVDGQYAARTTYAHGCGPNAALGQVTCHNLANLAVLHQNQPKKGCTICHTPSGTKVGAAECLTCHPIGNTLTPYANENLTERNVTLAPASDFGGAATVTRTGGTGTNASTQLTNDGVTSQLQFTSLGRKTFGFTGASSLPSNAIITRVRISCYVKRAAGAGTTSKAGVTVNVGGTEYDNNVVTGTLNNTAYNLIYAEFAKNPARTGNNAWTLADVTDPNSTYGLKAIGVNQNTATTTNIMVTQTFATVYYTTGDLVQTPPVGSGMYHHSGAWNLSEPSIDATPGQLWYQGTPSRGWYEALYRQKCWDLCHAGTQNAMNMGPVLATWPAKTGSWMWYSVAGDYNDSPATRTLTSKDITIPTGATSLNFDTRYVLTTELGAITDMGYVEVSRNGGAFVPISGTVGGTTKASLSGTSAGWLAANYDLSAFAGSRVKIRFRYVNNINSCAEGWTIDNLVVASSQGTLLQDDAETENTNWTNYHWTRAHGAINTYWAY